MTVPHRAVLVFSLVLVTACGEGGGTEGGAGGASKALTPADAVRLVELENRGIGLLERYDYVPSIEPLRQALEIAPAWVPGRIHLAIALMNAQAEHYAEARQLLEGVLVDEPRNARAAFLAAFLAENAGDTERAAVLYRVAWDETRDVVAGAKLGTLLQTNDDLDAAQKVLEDVHARRPTLTSAVNALMLLHRRRGDDAQADAFMELLRTLKGAPNPKVPAGKVGQEITPAYGNIGDLSMADRNYASPVPSSARGAVDVTATVIADAVSWQAGRLVAGGAPHLGAAVFDMDDDGDEDVFLCGGDGPCALLRNDGVKDGRPVLTDVAASAGVALTGVYAAAAGELDVATDPRGGPRTRIATRIDLLLLRKDGLRLFVNAGDGTFGDATAGSGLDADPGGAAAVLVADFDQEGDLDVFLSGGPGQKNRLWSNRGPGVFDEIAMDAGVAGDEGGYGPALVLDPDRDYDLDLFVTRGDGPPVLYRNDRLMKFHADPAAVPVTARAARGALTGDFDRDGAEDLLLLDETSASLLLGVRDARKGATFEARALAGAPGGPAIDVDLGLRGLRDLVFAEGARLPGVEGDGPFGAAAPLFEALPGANVFAVDLDGIGTEELVLLAPGASPRVLRVSGAGQGGALSLDFQGVIRTDQAGWSNLEGRGALVEARTGAAWQQRRVGGTGGYGVALPTRQVFGVGDAAQADFVRVLWPDAVQQGALDIPAGAPYTVIEQQLRPDSCPLIFTWDGHGFAFVADFLGAGGLGFLVEPGVYAQPDPTETVRIPEGALVPDEGGLLDVRLVEAMEETCYLDRVELVAVDHDAALHVYPDERFTGAPPFADGKLVAHTAEILPVAARDAAGRDVLDAVSREDRRYHEDHLTLHPRLLGATGDNVLELDFGDRLDGVAPGDPLVFHGNGWIEYGYTRTSVAAAGERFTYLPPVLEVFDEGTQSWRAVAPDFGFPAGFPRTMTYDLTGKVSRATPRLRIRTNFEVYWDRVWLARPVPLADVATVTSILPDTGVLRRLGYPREYSPDGRHPRIYDYQTLDQSMPWKTVTGDYTRFGDVLPLLTDADDRYVIHGKGEEIAVTFDSARLPPLAPGRTRTYFLRLVGWCKGQELYTADGFTVEPLPFLGMTNYPYVDGESYPDTPELRKYRAEWNTRRVR